MSFDPSTYVPVTCVTCGRNGFGPPSFANWRCRDCRPQAGAQGDPEPVVNAHAGSPYRCRAHHEVPVDSRGKGCGRCDDERRPRREPRPEPLVIR